MTSPPSSDQARAAIRAAGLRATGPRIAVLRLLSQSPRPLSHSDVVQSLGSDDCDPATLYRNLVRLVEAGLARVASTAGGINRYEARREDGPHLHPHFTCSQCGKVTCIEEAHLTGPIDKRWLPSLEDAELQLIGRCPECRAPSD